MNIFEIKEFDLVLKQYTQIYDGNVLNYQKKEIDFQSNNRKISTRKIFDIIKDMYYNELSKLKSKSKTYYFRDESKDEFVRSLSTNSLKIDNHNITPRYVFITDSMLTNLGLYGFTNDEKLLPSDMMHLTTLIHNSKIYRYDEPIEDFGTGMVYLVSDPILNVERFLQSLKYEINGDNHKITYYEYECMYNVIRVVFRDAKSWRLSVINSVLD